jgi:Lrp/AsnC family transcriptional regulator, leucine-responsive regulatory protein
MHHYIHFAKGVFIKMDKVDIQLLKILQEDARITVSDLSKKLALSRPSVSERLLRLQEKGIILEFSARISPAKLGRETLLYIQISELKEEPHAFEEFIKTEADIIECHRVTGTVSYIIKAAVSGIDGMRNLVDRLIPYGTINTSVILASPVPFRHILPNEQSQ